MGNIRLVLLRHGESVWNKENKFTGWTDVDLSDKGREEAKEAGRILKKEDFTFEISFTSVLKRAIRTLWIVLDEMELMWVPVHCSWRLNERHYGALQGLNKLDMVKKFGEEQVLVWRRSYDVSPPPLDKDKAEAFANDPRYNEIRREAVPLTESLKDTVARFVPYWKDVIAPVVHKGKRVIISAHGNSLRALVKYLDKLSDEDIVRLNIPTGIPLVYELDRNLSPMRHYYLGDSEKIEEAVNAVGNQIKIK